MKLIEDAGLTAQYMRETGFGDMFSTDISDLVQLWAAARGEYIMRQGQVPAAMYYIASGSARLYDSLPNGKVLLLDIFGPGNLVGEIELLMEGETSLDVKAQDECILLGMPMAACRRRLLADAVFLRHLCIMTAGKERQKSLALVQSQGYPLINRLAAFILRTQTDGRYCERNVDAAAWLGVSYRHLMQVLSDLSAQGLIEKAGQGYDIKDEAGLIRLAREMGTDCTAQ